jgi:integrase
MKMNELFDLYEAECIPNMQPRSQRDYRGIMLILRQWFGDKEASEVRPRHVYEFINVPTGRIHRNRMVTILSTVFKKAMGRWCLDENLTNPCTVVERWPTSPRDRYVTSAELVPFRATCSPQLQIAIDLAVLLGQRQGDLVALTWEQVRTVGIQREQWHIKFRQSKTGKRLAVRLSLAVEKVLDRAWLMQESPRTYVIQNQHGTRYTDDGFRAMWQRHMRAWAAAGHERFHFHDLRAKAGSDSKDVEAAFKLLGHQSISMTQRVYERGERMVEPSA